jgi:hypothetical protein
MSYNRLIYDKCSYAKVLQESTSPLDYFLSIDKYENNTNCKISDHKNILPFGDRADVESELYGITRPGSLCPSLKFDPLKNFKNPAFSPPTMCANIYYITPNNIEKPTNNMLNNNDKFYKN